MSKQLTAVEWLEKKGLEGFISTEDFEQAKEMEREQIISARKDGIMNSYPMGNFDSQQYYNETYKVKGTFK